MVFSFLRKKSLAKCPPLSSKRTAANKSVPTSKFHGKEAGEGYLYTDLEIETKGVKKKKMRVAGSS